MKNSAEPVLLAAAIANVLIAVASIFGVVLELSAVECLVVAVFTIAAAFRARKKVTPTG